MDIFEPLGRVPKRVLLPAIGALGLVAALGLTSVGIGPSFLGWSNEATGGKASAQPGGSSDGEARIYSIADFVNRSPGERGEVNAFKKGFVRSVVASLGRGAEPAPTQRALGKIFDEETAGLADVPEASLAASPVTGLDGIPLVPEPVGAAPGPLFGGAAPIFAAAPGPVIIPLPGGPPPSGGGGGGGGILDGPITLPSAVPEPGTWAMIIMGLFGIGLAMRRANKARADGWNLSAS